MLILGVLGVYRWLAIGNKAATGASAAAQPASQQSQTQAVSKVADPSRWLGRGAMDTLRWQVCAASTVVCASSCFRGQQAHRNNCFDWPGCRSLKGGSADELWMRLGGRRCLQAPVAEGLAREERWRHTRMPLTEELQAQAGGGSAGVLSEAVF